MAQETRVSITEVTVLTGKKKAFKLNVDGKTISIPVDENVFAHYKDQFVREAPSQKQRNVFGTLMNLMRAAYLQGREDGKKEVRGERGESK